MEVGLATRFKAGLTVRVSRLHETHAVGSAWFRDHSAEFNLLPRRYVYTCLLIKRELSDPNMYKKEPKTELHHAILIQAACHDANFTTREKRRRVSPCRAAAMIYGTFAFSRTIWVSKPVRSCVASTVRSVEFSDATEKMTQLS